MNKKTKKGEGEREGANAFAINIVCKIPSRKSLHFEQNIFMNSSKQNVKSYIVFQPSPPSSTSKITALF